MRPIQRRDFLRTGLLSIGALSVPGLLAACSKKSNVAAARTSLRDVVNELTREGGKQAVDTFLAGEDWVRGINNHLAFGLVRRGADPIVGVNGRIWLAPSPDLSGEPIGPFEAGWRGYSKPESGGPPGIHAAEVRFDRGGIWTMLVDVRPERTPLFGVAAIQVKEKASTRIPGEKAIPSETPTVDDNRGVNPICTRTPPCELHRVTLKQAIGLGKPSLFIMATPKFCMSRTCGPNLEELITVSQQVGDRATFVHAEVYKDDRPETISRFVVSPTYKEWNFQSEPWLFVLDRSGTVTARFEGPLTASDIRGALDPLLG